MAFEGEEHKEGLEPRDGRAGLYGSAGWRGRIFRKTLIQSITFLSILLVVLLAGRMIQILLLLFAGILLGILLDIFGSQFMRMKMPHWLAISIVLVALMALLVLIVFWVFPIVAEEMDALGSQIRQSVQELREWLRRSAGGRFLVDQIPENNDGRIWERVAGIFSITMGAVGGIGVVVIIGVFLAYSPGIYKTGFLHLVPPDRRRRAVEVMAEIGVTLRWWLLGQLISMTVLAVSTWAMLTLMGLPLALILALITGILTFIPYIGPLIAMVPIVLLAFMQSPLMALYVFILYMAIQNVESNVLMPIVFHRTVHIPPALGVISQIFFGSLLGVLGFILAVPLMAAILQFMKMVYVEDVLGDTE